VAVSRNGAGEPTTQHVGGLGLIGLLARVKDGASCSALAHVGGFAGKKSPRGGAKKSVTPRALYLPDSLRLVARGAQTSCSPERTRRLIFSSICSSSNAANRLKPTVSA
jgi:hypothetical protein